MLTTEATHLLERIARAMRPAQPPWHNDTTVLTEWAATVIHHNATAAHVNTVMRNNHDAGNTRWPNLYQFSDLLKRQVRARQHDPTQQNGCAHCHGNGWVIANDTIERHGHQYNYCQPCGCPAGRNAEQTTLWKELTNAGEHLQAT